MLKSTVKRSQKSLTLSIHPRMEGERRHTSRIWPIIRACSTHSLKTSRSISTNRNNQQQFLIHSQLLEKILKRRRYHWFRECQNWRSKVEQFYWAVVNHQHSARLIFRQYFNKIRSSPLSSRKRTAIRGLQLFIIIKDLTGCLQWARTRTCSADRHNFAHLSINLEMSYSHLIAPIFSQVRWDKSTTVIKDNSSHDSPCRRKTRLLPSLTRSKRIPK